MTAKEQRESCEICQYHKIINCLGGMNIMSCHYGDYRNHPVWGDFECPLGDNKPIRKTEPIDKWW